MKRSYNYLLMIPILMGLLSCEKFLSQRNTSQVSNISSLKDMQALLDAGNVINMGGYTPLLEIATDNYFLTGNGVDRISDLYKSIYLWEPYYDFLTTIDISINWTKPFHIISIANNILDELPLVVETSGLNSYHIEGSALFHRAFAYHNLVQVYCKAYNSQTASNDLGLPLRLNSDINLPSVRASLEETYRIIEEDVQKSIDLLPVYTEYKTRPTKAAGHALLARVYLLMGRYDEAAKQADLSLGYYNTMMDFNHIDSSLLNPIDPLNNETIFLAYTTSEVLLASNGFYIDTTLLNCYYTNDLRKGIFFQDEHNGYYSFKGSYGGQSAITCFLGLTVSELLLIKAESLVRTGNMEGSLNALNSLLINRYEKSTFEPMSIHDPEELLVLILEERRKELIFRGARWSDLKRLNLDPRFAKTLIRKIPGSSQQYELPPNDPRYVYLIPQDVIEKTNMKQNPR